MKVLIYQITGSWGSGNTSIWHIINMLTKELIDQGHEVGIIECEGRPTNINWGNKIFKTQNTIPTYKEGQKIHNEFQFDLIINTQPLQSFELFNAFKIPFLHRTPVIVNYFLGGPPEIDFSTKQEAEVVYMSLLMFPTIANSRYTYKHLKEGLVSRFGLKTFISKANLSYEDIGLNIEKLDDFLKNHKPNKEDGTITFCFGGRLDTVKRVYESIELVNYLCVKGYKVKYKLALPVKEEYEKAMEWKKTFGFLEPIPSKSVDEFYQACIDSDFCFFISKAETYGIAYYEMMYLGCIPFIQKQPYMEGILNEEHQIFIGPDKTNTVATLEDTIEAYRKNRLTNYSEQQREYFRNNQNMKKNTGEVIKKALSFIKEPKKSKNKE